MAAITIVGVGPGDPDLLTLKARDVIRSADYVAGFETVLGPVRRWISGEALPMRYRDQEDVLERLAAHAADGKRCVVCAWGDLNFSSKELLDRVRQARRCGTHPRHQLGAGGVRPPGPDDGDIALHHPARAGWSRGRLARTYRATEAAAAAISSCYRVRST